MRKLLPNVFVKADKDSYYYRYMHQARLFEGVGIILLLIGIVINEMAGQDMKPLVIIFSGIGIVLLIIGGSSAQPHVTVKSFASLLRNNPSTENAKEFVRALEYIGTVSLVQSSINMVDTAVMAYEHCDEVDVSVLNKLKSAVEEHIHKKIF